MIIFEDYNKGMLTEKVIHGVMSLCKKSNVLTAVDPKRKNFFSYSDVDIFKPNLKEVKEGLNLILVNVNKQCWEIFMKKLPPMLRHKISFITLSDKGVFYQQMVNRQ